MDAASFATAIKTEFNRITTRNSIRLGKTGGYVPLVGLSVDIAKTNIVLSFDTDGESYLLEIPIPYADESQCIVISSSDSVVRAVNSYKVKKINTESEYTDMDYLTYIYWNLTENLKDFYSYMSSTSLLERIINGLFSKNQQLAVSQAQRHIDSKIINCLPICGSSMKTWAMNRKVMIIDPIFDLLTPDQKLQYQVEKNKLFFPYTSIGLSDGVLADQNSILKEDLKPLTPFAMRHHNPQRNLYQTLGMKGDNKPTLVTESEHRLISSKVTRTGWNLMTAFLTTPDTFEDQIIVDNRLKNLSIREVRKFISYGIVLTRKGESLVHGSIISVEPDNSEQRFEVHCDSAIVDSITKSESVINGERTETNIISVELTRKFKEGFKITNRHANKGVIRFKDLGTVKDPVRGNVPLDVLVSCDSVKRRKNFGQILEALTTLIYGPKEKIVIPDDYKVTEKQVSNALSKNGYSKDGTCEIETSFGKFKAICGWVFWGVTRTPEDQIWTPKETSQTNVLGLRTAGNKISAVELGAIITMLGPNNGVSKEIIQHFQGRDVIREELMIINSTVGKTDPDIPEVELSSLNVCEDGYAFHDKGSLKGTIHDPDVYPLGAYIKLPFAYYIAHSKSTAVPVYESTSEPPAGTFEKLYKINKIYMPAEILRRTWQHKTGLVGIGTIGTSLNKVIISCKKYIASRNNTNLENASLDIRRYFNTVSTILSGKKGHISTYAMAVRYPNSVKGVAVQKSELPPNTVEIHTSMAKALGIVHGQLVLCERFPCLGFTSLRIQKVSVTNDESCKFSIRVSGNSLVSQNLDFDGDVIYLMSFFTDEARKDLVRGLEHPNAKVDEIIKELNSRKVPTLREMNLNDIEVACFDPLTAATQAGLVERAVGVKAHTGPVIALCYNLMRIIETSSKYNESGYRASMEKFIDKIGNSVFSQKHGITSLQAACIEAVCCADAGKLAELGFPINESKRLCNTITEKARSLGIKDLVSHYQASISSGKSKIINVIVREENKAYFMSRSKLHGVQILSHLKQKPVDIPSHLFDISIRPRAVNLL